MSRHYTRGQRVLARVDKYLWAPGVVEDTDGKYEVRLDFKDEGSAVWYFSVSCVIADNRRNRMARHILTEGRPVFTPNQKARQG